VNVPSNFSSTTATFNVQGYPYWNDYSSDGSSKNVGYFLTGTNVNANGFTTNYLTSNSTPGLYLSTGAASPTFDAPSSFSFIREASSVTITLLYANSGVNQNISG